MLSYDDVVATFWCHNTTCCSRSTHQWITFVGMVNAEIAQNYESNAKSSTFQRDDLTSFKYCIIREGPPATTSCGIELSGQFSTDMMDRFWHMARPNGSLISGLSLMYKLSRLSRLATSSGMNCKLFSPTERYVRFDRWPIVLGRAVIWFDCRMRRCSSWSRPISDGILNLEVNISISKPTISNYYCTTHVPSSRFSSKSSTRSFRKLPIVVGIFRSKLFERMRISSCCRHWISSGSFVIEFVPKLSSTMFVHCPMSSGNWDCKWRNRLASNQSRQIN